MLPLQYGAALSGLAISVPHSPPCYRLEAVSVGIADVSENRRSSDFICRATYKAAAIYSVYRKQQIRVAQKK